MTKERSERIDNASEVIVVDEAAINEEKIDEITSDYLSTRKFIAEKKSKVSKDFDPNQTSGVDVTKNRLNVLPLKKTSSQVLNESAGKESDSKIHISNGCEMSTNLQRVNIL